MLRNYAGGLRRGMRHAALAVSRMLALWLEFADVQCQAYGGNGQAAATMKLHALSDREDRTHAQVEKDIAVATQEETDAISEFESLESNTAATTSHHT